MKARLIGLTVIVLLLVTVTASGAAGDNGVNTGNASSGNGSSGGGATAATVPPLNTGIVPGGSGASVRLVSQTPWVSASAPGNVFDLQILPTLPAGMSADNVELDINIDAVLPDRSEFQRSMTAAYSGYIIAQPIHAPLGSLTAGPRGVYDAPLSVGSQVGQVHLSAAGVYPVTVELRPLGVRTALTGFTTHLVYLPQGNTGPKLDVVWVLPVHAPPADATTTTGRISATALAGAGAIASALAAYPTVPLTLQPTPDTLGALEGATPAAVNQMGQSLSGREVLANTWVPMPLASMLAAGLSDQVSLSLTRGNDALSTDLATNVSTRTWVLNGPVDTPTLTFLRFAQFDQVVLPEEDLGANPSPLTPSQPFEVAGQEETFIRAAVADEGLAQHFSDQPDPVLGAHQLLADLTQIYADAPARERGVVVVAPPDWVPSTAFLDAFMSGLSNNPVLTGSTLDTFFATIPTALDHGTPLVRTTVTDGATIASTAGGLLGPAERAAQTRLNSLATALPSNTTVFPRLERLLLEIDSVDLSDSQRQARLAAFTNGVRQELALVQLPPSHTITLTARKGQLPITVASGSDEPLKVLLQVSSDKLKIPGADTAGVATFAMTLHKGDNPLVLTVTARTAGAFPLHLTVVSPDGNLTIATSNFTIQSTALSGVGVVLSISAALFLVLWWIRHAFRSRRSNRARARGEATA